jgi:hypothetical protein
MNALQRQDDASIRLLAAVRAWDDAQHSRDRVRLQDTYRAYREALLDFQRVRTY